MSIHEILSDYWQDFFFQIVFVGFIGFLGVVYLCFAGLWNWLSIFLFPSESCIKLFWGEEWFPFLLRLPIAPLGTV
jgi:hypothetical protein